MKSFLKSSLLALSVVAVAGVACAGTLNFTTVDTMSVSGAPSFTTTYQFKDAGTSSGELTITNEGQAPVVIPNTQITFTPISDTQVKVQVQGMTFEFSYPQGGGTISAATGTFGPFSNIDLFNGKQTVSGMDNAFSSPTGSDDSYKV